MSEDVRLLFSDLSESYDLSNDVLSFGMHRWWKRRFVRRMAPVKGEQILDLATGTGDIAGLFARRVGEEGEVVGVDFSAAMITYARKRARNTVPNARFEVGDAMDLRFSSDAFDLATISFGIRNVDNPEQVLREMKRVVRPGGRVGIMEFGQPTGLWGKMFRFYSGTIIPFVGGIISGNEDAYRYLDRTASTFASGSRFVEIMKQAGFETIDVEPLMGGIAWIYTGHVDERESGDESSESDRNEPSESDVNATR